jgi:hypothetical protein
MIIFILFPFNKSSICISLRLDELSIHNKG